MLERMYEEASQARVDAARTDLMRDPQLLENSALAVLSAAWAEEPERDRLRAVLTETNDKLPVVEVAILAIVCMYGMYLLATGGKKKSTKITKRKPDGSFESQEITDYTDPTGPLSTIVNIFQPSPSRIAEDPETSKGK